MNQHSAFANLRDSLAPLYPTIDDARRVIADIGLSAGRIMLSHEAINDWHAILTEAQNTNQIQALSDLTLREYRTNQGLRRAWEIFFDSQQRDQNLNVPIAIMAMSDQEAKELAEETVFTNWPSVDGNPIPKRGNEQEKFQNIKPNLPQNFFSTFKSERDAWSPYGGNVPMYSLVQRIASSLGYTPQSFSEKLFAAEQSIREDTVDYLQLTGCVLIIDAISMFHPRLCYLLDSSKLVSARESVATIILSPLDYTDHSLNQIIENDIRSSPQMSALIRRIENLDLLCEFGIGGQRNLLRWLHNILPKTAEIVQKELANNEQLERFRRSPVGQAVNRKTNIHQFFT